MKIINGKAKETSTISAVLIDIELVFETISRKRHGKHFA